MKRVLHFAIVIALVIALAALLCPCTACFQGQTPKQSAAESFSPGTLPTIAAKNKDWRADAGGDVGRRDELYRPREATPEPGPIPVLRI